MQIKSNQKKDPQSWKAYPNLYVRFYFDQGKILQTQSYPFSTDFEHDKSSNFLQINVNTIIKMTASVMKSKVQDKFINIFIEQDNKFINIFKFKKPGHNNMTVKLKRESQNFYLNVWIMDIDKIPKQNPLLDFTQQQKKYNKIIENLSEINKSFSKEVKKLNQNQKCSYDIAYMASQPLVQARDMVNFKKKKNLQYESIDFDQYTEAQVEVSFQKEYQKFISIFQAESYRSHIKIKIFIANENNLKNVLTKKCNILHFACHGQEKYLEIQKERDIGKLDPLTIDRLIKHLNGKSFLKMIIFNACESDAIAKKVNDQLGITTVGYVGKANDIYCEIFTERIYKGIYTEKKNFFKLFDEVKSFIISKDSIEGNKLRMYPGKEEPRFENLKTQFPTNSKYENDLENFRTLGNQEPIGIKKKLYEFIKYYLLNKERTKFFVIGPQGSGKTLFMKKALHYTLNRKVFETYMWINCREQGKKGKKPIMSMLQFNLLYRRRMREFIKKNKQTKIMIIIDHCNDLIGNDPEEFMDFFKKCQNRIKNGKIILITDDISYYTEINVMMEANVYQHKEISHQDNIVQYNKFLLRWFPNYPQVNLTSNNNWSKEFSKTRLKFWFQALRKSQRKEKFFQTLEELKQEERWIQQKGVLSNLENDITTFINKIRFANQQFKHSITSGNYSRSQSVFILLNIFPDFSNIRRNDEGIQISRGQVIQNRPKSLQELMQIYQRDIKGLIQNLIDSLGMFHSQNYCHDWWRDKILMITQTLFLIIGMAVIFQGEADGQEEIQNQIFNAYALVVKIMNRYQKILSQLHKVRATCDAIKLKIYMALYNLYKHQCFSAYTQEGMTMRKKRKTLVNLQQNNQFNAMFTSEIQQNRDSLVGNSNDFGNNFESQFRQSMGRESMGNPYRQNMGQRDSINFGQRDSINIGGRSSIRSNRGASEIKDLAYPATKQEFKRQVDYKESKLKAIQISIKHKYHDVTNQWSLIEKVQQLDTMIRKIQSEDSKTVSADPNAPSPVSSMFQFSWTECDKNLQTCYRQIEKFYFLHKKITNQYGHLVNYKQVDEENPLETYEIQRIFFTQIQLDLSYLQGLKIIRKILPFIEDQYVFDFQSRYKVKLEFIRKILENAENILVKSLAQKCKKGGDLSFKKFYREFLEIYVEIRFKLQNFCLLYDNNGLKQQVSVFNKLLLLSYDTGSFQLRDSIRKFIEKTFQNKCTILISQPVGFISKKKNPKKPGAIIKPSKSQKQNKKQKDKKSSYKEQNQNQIEHFLRLNIFRDSDLIIKQMKDEVEKKVKSQIHIQTQLLDHERLIIPSQSQEDEKKRKRLIYLIICDCKQTDTIYLENSQGESIKRSKKDFLTNQNFSFPYAPVVVLYGSTPQILKQCYKELCESQKKSISIISFITPNEVPEISENFKEMIEYVWKDYIQKKIGMEFLSEFWIKFCQVYFNQEHECHRNQIIRSFNIAKQESIISMKKKYVEGTSNSQLEKQIDNISKQISLDLYIRQDNNFAVILENNIKNGTENNQFNQRDLNMRENQTLKSSALLQSSTARGENQIMEILSHQIGCNAEIYEFLQRFWQNVQNFELGKDFSKNFIEYSPHLKQTSIHTFIKTIQHKLLRMSNKFELGVLFINMQKENIQESYASEIRLQPIQLNANIINLADFGFQSQPIQEELELPSSDDDEKQASSHRTIYERRKKVEVYKCVKQCNLKVLLEGLQMKDKSISQKTQEPNREGTNQYLDTVFRIFIVEGSINSETKNQLQKYHSCKVNCYKERTSYLENLYHMCDIILSHSKKIQNFNFMKTIDLIYPKKQAQEELKYLSSIKVKQKLIQHFKKHS